jgi:hypothetical protein
MLGFKNFHLASVTLNGIELVRMIRKYGYGGYGAGMGSNLEL